MPTPRRAALLCLTILLLLCALSACRGRSSFTPSAPPSDPATKSGYPADFQCWVRYPDGIEVALPAEDTVEVYAALRKMSRSSKAVEAFPQKENSLRFVFCTGGTAPETTVPAYQLPNATLYGVYTLFPDDTGWYGDNLITAHVHSFRLKEGSFASLLALADPS